MTLKEPANGRGITRKETVLALLLVVLVAVGAFGVLNFPRQTNTNNSPTTSLPNQSTDSTLSSSGIRQPNGLLDVFGIFSSMAVSDVVNNPDEGIIIDNATYAVLGHTLVNSTDYYRVQFTNNNGNITTILWFDQHGNVSVAEVKGDRNYTGSVAGAQGGFFTSLFSSTLVDNNATLLIGLQKTGEVLQDIGPTQMSVSTYELSPSNTSLYAAMTIKIATIPGTNVSLLVYLNQVPTDPEGTSEVFQVTSLTRS